MTICRYLVSLVLVCMVFFGGVFGQDGGRNIPPASPQIGGGIGGGNNQPVQSQGGSATENALNCIRLTADEEIERRKSGPGVCGIYKYDDRDYIILNTNIPFIGRCIQKRSTSRICTNGEIEEITTTATNVFPKFMAYLIRITMTILVIGGFLGILIGGFMIASNGAFGTKQTGTKLILGVIAGLILLGASGIILNLIDPNFFGTAS